MHERTDYFGNPVAYFAVQEAARRAGGDRDQHGASDAAPRCRSSPTRSPGTRCRSSCCGRRRRGGAAGARDGARLAAGAAQPPSCASLPRRRSRRGARCSTRSPTWWPHPSRLRLRRRSSPRSRRRSPRCWRQRRGVCQDFAHLGIGCLRSLGLPARYVSGYIESQPPPGQPRRGGADASHAWFAVYDPTHGWVDFDPTNDQIVGRSPHHHRLGPRLRRRHAAEGRGVRRRRAHAAGFGRRSGHRCAGRHAGVKDRFGRNLRLSPSSSELQVVTLLSCWLLGLESEPVRGA